MSNTSLKPERKSFTADEAAVKKCGSLVVSVMFLMVQTRPDLAQSVSVLLLTNPDKSHIGAAKQFIKVPWGSIELRLGFRGNLELLKGYVNADFAGDLATRRSTAGYVFNLGSGAVSWCPKRQTTIALSKCEAEYMGQTQTMKEAI